MDPPQILLEIPKVQAPVAGLPAALRAALSAEELHPSKTFFFGLDAGFMRRWHRQLSSLKGSAVWTDGQAPSEWLDPKSPLLVISGSGYSETGALKRFHKEARGASVPLRWVCDGKTVAAYFPDVKALLAGAGATADSLAHKALAHPGEIYRSPESRWWTTSDAAGVDQAERALFKKLPQDSDGYLAQFDRRLSMALSRRLIRLPITPNQITTASLMIGLLGAWLLARGPYPAEVLGAVLLWSCCILDGCDGEVARLKHLASRAGGLYDVIADNIVHLAVFVAIPLNLQRARPETSFLWPGALLVTGMLACMFSVWWVVLRRPQAQRGAAGLIVERIASRDFLYLILLLVLIGKLQWFLWAAALGSHLFNAALWIMFWKRPRT